MTKVPLPNRTKPYGWKEPKWFTVLTVLPLLLLIIFIAYMAGWKD